MNYDVWISEWTSTIDAIKKIGGDIKAFEISPKSNLSKVEEVESELGFSLPISFKKVLLEFSAAVNVIWFLPDNFELPSKFKSIFSGELSWNIEKLIGINQDKDEFIKTCFADEDDAYNRVWHNTLAFVDVGNGDYIAFDLEDGADGRVIFLSHDGDTSNGYVLGRNFIEFINELTGICCCGPEDWQMMPFIETPESGIDSKCCNAIEFRDVFRS